MAPAVEEQAMALVRACRRLPAITTLSKTGRRNRMALARTVLGGLLGIDVQLHLGPTLRGCSVPFTMVLRSVETPPGGRIAPGGSSLRTRTTVCDPPFPQLR